MLLHLKRQALHAATHVRVARRDPDPTSRRDRDHDRNAFKVARDHRRGRIRADPDPDVLHLHFDDAEVGTVRRRGNVGDGRGGVSMITGENPQAPALCVRRASRRHL